MSLPAPPDGPILAIGEPMIELSGLDPKAGAARIGFAGDTLNTAIYLARAFAGTPRDVGFVTVLGTDSLSDAMIAQMTAEGIATDRIARHPDRLPGVYAIELTPEGERSFLYWRSASAARTLFEFGPAAGAALAGAGVIYVSGITLAILSDAARADLIATCAAARDAGGIVAFDSNYRPRLWPDALTASAAFDAMWRASSIGLPSADDEALLHPGDSAAATLDRIAGHGVDEVVLKRGSEGPVVRTAGGDALPPARPADRVVDTTAAGDSFNAGYLHARLTGADPAAAAMAGHELAAHVIGFPGAIVPADAPGPFSPGPRSRR